MQPAVLFPLFDHPAIEERYASWQAQYFHSGGRHVHFYPSDEPARDAVEDIESDLVLVVTDPLLLPSPGLAERLSRALSGSGAFAAVPVTNEAANAQQRVAMPPYVTVREFEVESARVSGGNERVTWDQSDPGVFLCATAALREMKSKLHAVLAGREVIVARSAYVHRWSSLRGQTRLDLLERISPDARSVLEFGCGEGTLGEALKKRQKVRVVGIELDKQAAAIARKRIDDVYQSDVREVVALLNEKFDWIVGGDIVEHLDEPWSFLGDLRRLSKPGGHLLLSLPNIANASIIGDLLQGRFDYVYMGLLCVGHLRFFTRRSIEEMLSIAGWTPEQIEPQPLFASAEQKALIDRLAAAGIAFSREDLLAPGFYVTARNPGSS